MRTYKEYIDEISNTKYIQFEEGEKVGWIPLDSANADYQAYLRWLENPNADESVTVPPAAE